MVEENCEKKSKELLQDFKDGSLVLQAFSDYKMLEKVLEGSHDAEIAALRTEACAKFPILVLGDLNKLICFREKFKNLAVTRPYDLRYRAYNLYWRPGCYEFLQKIMNHDRVKFAFFSTISER